MKKIILLFLFLSFNVELFSTDSLNRFVERHVFDYQFDTDEYRTKYLTIEELPEALNDRKTAIFYCYHLLQKAKYSESYEDLIDNIHEAIGLVTEDKDAQAALRANALTYEEFKAEYKRLGVDRLPVVNFGIVIEGRLLPKGCKSKRVIGFGAKHFLVWPESKETSPFVGLEEKTHLAINHVFNGLAFDLKEEEFEILPHNNYLIKKMPFIRMEKLQKDSFEIEYAYTIISPKEQQAKGKPDLKSLCLILSGYKEDNLKCRDFLRLMTETSYLEDGETSIAKWLEEEVKAYHSIESPSTAP